MNHDEFIMLIKCYLKKPNVRNIENICVQWRTQFRKGPSSGNHAKLKGVALFKIDFHCYRRYIRYSFITKKNFV